MLQRTCITVPERESYIREPGYDGCLQYGLCWLLDEDERVSIYPFVVILIAGTHKLYLRISFFFGPFAALVAGARRRRLVRAQVVRLNISIDEVLRRHGRTGDS